jgi:hypothetical protein
MGVGVGVGAGVGVGVGVATAVGVLLEPPLQPALPARPASASATRARFFRIDLLPRDDPDISQSGAGEWNPEPASFVDSCEC